MTRAQEMGSHLVPGSELPPPRSGWVQVLSWPEDVWHSPPGSLEEGCAEKAGLPQSLADPDTGLRAILLEGHPQPPDPQGVTRPRGRGRARFSP